MSGVRELLVPLLASCSVPGILPPVKDGDRWLVDGAVSSPVPTTVAAELGGDVVIGVSSPNSRSPRTAVTRAWWRR